LTQKKNINPKERHNPIGKPSTQRKNIAQKKNINPEEET